MTEPSTNGSAHNRNGHAPGSRPAGDVPPLDTVSHGDTEEAASAAKSEAKPKEGRTAQGTFAPGNKCARGNPTAHKMAAFRSALLGNLTPEKMAALGDKLYAAALDGDLNAAKLLITYAVGKAPEAVDPDRLDLDEWHIRDAAPTLFQVYRALIDNTAPAFAAELLRMGQQGSFDDLLKRFGERQRAESPTFGNRIADERKARVGK